MSAARTRNPVIGAWDVTQLVKYLAIYIYEGLYWVLAQTWAWWLMPTVPALRMWRWEVWRFKVILSCLKIFKKKENLEKKGGGAEKLTQWVKVLAIHKCADQNWDSRNHLLVCICKPSTPTIRGETKPEESPPSPGIASLEYAPASNRRPCLKQGDRQGLIPEAVLWPLHKHIHKHIYIIHIYREGVAISIWEKGRKKNPMIFSKCGRKQVQCKWSIKDHEAGVWGSWAFNHFQLSGLLPFSGVIMVWMRMTPEARRFECLVFS